MDKETIKSERKTLLIVDDSLIARRMVRFALHGIDYTILEAADGTEAVRILYSQTVDLMVTDLNMPNMNGFELSRIVRESKGMADMPIIMISQDDSQEHKDEARQNGISLFISKPFTPEQFSDLVVQVLR